MKNSETSQQNWQIATNQNSVYRLFNDIIRPVSFVKYCTVTLNPKTNKAYDKSPNVHHKLKIVYNTILFKLR